MAISDDDKLMPAGRVASVLEGVIIVQVCAAVHTYACCLHVRPIHAQHSGEKSQSNDFSEQVPELGRVFGEGTVLCLEDRTPLGRVTEVFGPIQAPLYALRYSGSAGPLPGTVTAGAHVCAVEKYASALEAEAVQQQVGCSVRAVGLFLLRQQLYDTDSRGVSAANASFLWFSSAAGTKCRGRS